ncbi:hypothetical protein [uncultured Desulfobulbus sp.]|uniref:hypothetical protein n=1 Tax=uncultured Desulfobulbus sp. TaxID=239745 RepID=UPI0029C70B63|nr:hypothetical protein [uncultured Desulfobulbus sp.]
MGLDKSGGHPIPTSVVEFVIRALLVGYQQGVEGWELFKDRDEPVVETFMTAIVQRVVFGPFGDDPQNMFSVLEKSDQLFFRFGCALIKKRDSNMLAHHPIKPIEGTQADSQNERNQQRQIAENDSMCACCWCHFVLAFGGPLVSTFGVSACFPRITLCFVLAPC